MSRKRKDRDYLSGKKKFCKTSTAAHQTISAGASPASSRLWQGCGEGFELQFGDTRKQETCVSVKESSKGFAHKWIQPAMVVPPSQNIKHRIPKENVSTETEISEDGILFNSSESDSEDHTKVIQKQVKQACAQKTCRERRNRKMKRKNTVSSLSSRHFESETVESDPCLIISASDSEDNSKGVETELCVPISRESSPMSDIMGTDSPKGQSDEAADSSENDFDIQSNEEAHFYGQSPEQKLSGGQGRTPSISSCASSQTPGDGDVSPGPSGLRASEWARQVCWETTPTKQQITSPKNEGDSAKKKKRYKKDGLASQLFRIISRDKSSSRMWKHQLQAHEDISQGTSTKCLTVSVVTTGSLYSLHVARCTIMDVTGATGINSDHCLILFSGYTSQHVSTIHPGCVVKIFPPWQLLNAQDGKEKVLLCTRYHSVSASLSDDSLLPQQQPTAADLLSTFPVARGSWMCPCSKDGGMVPSRCPAHLFPLVPACLMQPNTSQADGRSSCNGNTLLTVTCSDHVPKRILTFDTLLESIEKSHSGDKLLPSFQATVLRVFCETTEDTHDLRHLLLVEDAQGTVALVSGGDDSLIKAGQELEGCYCCFSKLTVQSRINRDKDPILFSVIESAWCRRTQTTHSQESDSLQLSGHSAAHSQHKLHPPAFCYTLAPNDAVYEALSGIDTITVTASENSEPPPILVQTFTSALQTAKQSQRVSVVAKVIYAALSQGRQTLPDQSDILMELFVVDHTLPVDECQSSLLPGRINYVKVCVRPGCVTDHIKHAREGTDMSPYILLLRDVWIIEGSWIADKYSHILSLDDDTLGVESLVRRLESKLVENVRNCTPSLPPISSSSSFNTLVYITGAITSVDEKSAFSWDECDGCGSDQLGTRCSTGSLVCMGCKKEVTSPVQKMKMDVDVICDADSSLTVKISLAQSTIQQLLPAEVDEEGYDVDSVMNKRIGPLNCVITRATHTSAVLNLTAKELASWGT